VLSLLQDIFYYPIFNVLMFLYWLVGDFGLSIVLLTVLVRLALVPMTFKQLRSQRKMMEIQPQINALKEQYKGDQQGFARAQMQLMKENNVSMLGGCLPLLVQLPFLYGLFYALRDGLIDPDGAPKLCYASLGVCSPALVAGIESGQVAKLGPLFAAQARAGRVSGECYTGPWVNVGTPHDLDQANQLTN